MNDAQRKAIENFLDAFENYKQEMESAVFIPTHSPDLSDAVEELRKEFLHD